MEKVYTLGKCDYNDCGNADHTCKFEFELNDTDKGPAFSMRGSIWFPNMRCTVAGAQCCDKLAAYFPADKKAARMVEVWQQYHYNDRHPECEHQRELGWCELARKQLSLYEYTMTSDVCHSLSAIRRSIDKQISATGSAQITKEEQELFNKPYSIKTHIKDNYPDYGSEVEHRVVAGGIYATEHPEGLLGKPCPVCGYKYGSAWFYMPIPNKILEEIRSW